MLSSKFNLLNQEKNMIITIDGPVASGKSSVAKALAKELKIYYLYTGLLYRAVAYVLRERLKKKKGRRVFEKEFEDFVEKFTEEDFSFIKNICYDYGKSDGEKRPYIFYENEEITDKLYDISLDQPASIISAKKSVREALIDLQRSVAEQYSIVADGRDCGSVVFPDAEHKFYLTASSQVRAQRLMLDMRRDAGKKTFEQVKASLEERDRRDKEREVSPLIVPENATVIDNSNLNLKETIEKFLSYL
jgi:cytidylate kinase